jgi:hypothetical protein
MATHPTQLLCAAKREKNDKNEAFGRGPPWWVKLNHSYNIAKKR